MEPWLWWDLLKKATEQYSVSRGIFFSIYKMSLGSCCTTSGSNA